jgi:hypothetical protein
MRKESGCPRLKIISCGVKSEYLTNVQGILLVGSCDIGKNVRLKYPNACACAYTCICAYTCCASTGNSPLVVSIGKFA